MYPRLAYVLAVFFACTIARADDWKTDKVWNDGLVEKAVYSASRVIYGQPRTYEAVFFTNKEMHDRRTLTKAESSTDVVEVWKHNHVEVVPTPNYDYKFVTTSHLTTTDWQLTRLDCSSQEFCGTSFKQYIRPPMMSDAPGQFMPSNRLQYLSFSYMPETGRLMTVTDAADLPIVAEDSLPLWLRDYDFIKREPVRFSMLPTQKSNRPSDHRPASAMVQYKAEQPDGHELEVLVDGKVRSTYRMATDRLHVMQRMESEGVRYDLTSVARVDYWTIARE